MHLVPLINDELNTLEPYKLKVRTVSFLTGAQPSAVLRDLACAPVCVVCVPLPCGNWRLAAL